MEHRLILGGAQYLPFARSRIKALRAAGLTYATQRFVLPDAEVEVSIQPDHDHIRITGEICAFPMDSGMVDVVATGSAAPQRFDSGTLYETDSVAVYNAPYVPTDPPTEWRVNPGEGSAGQFAGKVTRTENTYRGQVPYDAQPARSFESEEIEDEALYLKKVTATACPASIFTGRCRLYVQTMYGLPLYNDNGKRVQPPYSLVPTETDAPPRLSILGRKTGQEPVIISTNSGVYLDAQGRHWLSNVNSTNIALYPLKSNACGEALRKSLLSETLSTTDKAHIEAYILSWARPDVEALQVLPLNRAVPTFAMGYGWHWNWSGTAADIVDVTPVASENPFAGHMLSSHQRITLAVDDEGAFSFVVTDVEAPSEWVVLRAWWCFAHPNYALGMLTKATPKLSELMECDAPIYVFYRGDTPVVCRVKVETNEQTSYREISDYFASTMVPGSPFAQLVTFGMDDGFGEDHFGGDDYWTCTISCAGISTGKLPQNKASTGVRTDVHNKVDEGVWGYGFSRDGVWNDVYLPAGVQGYPAGPFSETVGPFNSVLVRDDEIKRVTYDITNRNFSDTTTGLSIVVVPFYDAEAIFIQGTSTRQRNVTGSVTRWATANSALNEFGPPFVRRSGVYPYPAGPSTTWFERTLWAPGGGAYGARLEIPEQALPATSEQAEESDLKVLICHAGAIPATFPGASEFHDNLLEEVGHQYPTWSGSSRTATVVLAPVNNVREGIQDAPIAIPVVVGWA